MRFFYLTVVFCLFAESPIDGKDIENLLQNYLTEHSRSNVRYTLLKSPKKVFVPDSTFIVKIDLSEKAGEKSLVVNLVGEEWKRGITCRILREDSTQYFSPKYDLKKGRTISRNDFVETSGWISLSPEMALEGEQYYIVSKNLKKGKALPTNFLDEKRDVEPRQNVEVIWRKGSILVKTKAVALGRADIGESVPVHLKGKTYNALVIASGKVEIQ